MRFNIDWMEQKEYQGRKYVLATITNEQGEKYDVSLGDKWGDKLATLMPGQDIEGNTWQNPKNGKWSLYPIEEKKSSRGSFTPTRAVQNDISKSVEAAQKRTTESVNKTLDRKDESIRLSSAQRDAVLIVNTLIHSQAWNQDVIKEEIIKWRNWFLSEEFTDVPPF